MYADFDNDGIADYRDDCMSAKETINGFKDSDGCPDTHEETSKQPSKLEYKDLAYSSKSTYQVLIDGLTSGIKTAEDSLSGLKYESPDAQKKIQQAWEERWYALQSMEKAKLKWDSGVNEMNKNNFNTAVNFFKGIDSNSISIGNNLRGISAAINDAESMEAQYQSEKASKKEEKFCFLFWCW